jgi:hypothetical protein
MAPVLAQGGVGKRDLASLAHGHLGVWGGGFCDAFIQKANGPSQEPQR